MVSIKGMAAGLVKLGLVLSLSGLGLGALSATPAAPAERLLVWARAGVGEADLIRGFAPYRVSRQRLGRQGWHILTVPPGMRAADLHHRLSLHPWLQHIEADRLHPLSQALNDPFAGSQWHLPRIAVEPAWALASGMGRGVTVAVLDSGAQPDHPDLEGVLARGWNVVEGNANTQDLHGHGTSVVGLLAAQLNNGRGVAGMASGARIMPIRVTQPDGNARTSDIALGIQRAADEGARIVNISFDGVMGSALIRSAAQMMVRQGGLVVVAAGNRGVEETLELQAGLLVVGAIDERDTRPAWANFGGHLALAAPGEGLWTTGLGSGYRVVWGTSFAAPLVAATAALMWEVAPDATPALVEQWLRASAVDLGVPGYDVQYGHGRLNAGAAVAAASQWQAARGATSQQGLAQGTGTTTPTPAATPSSAVSSPTVGGTAAQRRPGTGWAAVRQPQAGRGRQ